MSDQVLGVEISLGCQFREAVGRVIAGKDFSVEAGTDAWTVDDAFQEVRQDLVNAASWYMRKKSRKRRASRILRLVSIVLAIVGAAVPFAATLFGLDLALGYLLLLLAAGIQFLDRAFGLSDGWSRQLVTAIELQRCLREFQLDYSSQVAMNAAEEQRWLCIRNYSTRGWILVCDETYEWANGLRAVADQLPDETQLMGAGRQAVARPGAKRGHAPPAGEAGS